MITILGPTASGKTKLAANLASEIDGEIISADSRQVFKGMTLGTGKDYNDYYINGTPINYHLIDIAEPGNEFSVFEFQNEFLKVYNNIIKSSKIPILCGGTGLYLESVIKGYKLINVPENSELRFSLVNKTEQELEKILLSYKQNLHNNTDTIERKRLLRAIEIEEFYKKLPETEKHFPEIQNTIFGVKFSREIICKRIENRLKQRFDEGMIAEVENLIDNGVPINRLLSYGLEYKFITEYIIGLSSFDEMFNKLNIAIRQFAKRQMTWFRRMERNGIEINWIDENLSDNERVNYIKCFN